MLFLTNVTTGIIGVIGIIFYVVVYSMWSKRLYVSNTVIGSISGAVPPLIGWAAVDPSLPANGLDALSTDVHLAAAAFLCAGNAKGGGVQSRWDSNVASCKRL